MEELIKQFEEIPPELVFEWEDKETNAKGWIVINSLRGGAAAGGTRGPGARSRGRRRRRRL